MNILQLGRIVWAYRRIESLILLAALALAVVFNILLPRQYTATASVFVDARSPDPVAGMVLPGIGNPGYMTTQGDIVRSGRVARMVANRLKLEQRGFIRKAWMEATDGKIALQAWIPEFLQKHLGVAPANDSSVINIFYTARTPAFAAEVANAFAQSYRDACLELKLERARDYAAWFEGQTRLVRERLAAAQQALSDYQNQAGVLEPDERIDFESGRLNAMLAQLTGLQAEIIENRNKSSSPRVSALAEATDNDVVSALKIDINRLDAKIKEAGAALDANHPRMIQMRQELAAMRAQLANEIARVVDSIRTGYQISLQREQDLQRAITAQKARVLAMNRQRAALNVYRRDVESAQRAYEAVSSRAAQTRLESLSDQTNAVVLSAATAPTAPSRPRPGLTLLVAAIAGAMLALGSAVLLELSNRRVRSPDDLALIGLPMLAMLGPSRRRPGQWPRTPVRAFLYSMRKVALRG